MTIKTALRSAACASVLFLAASAWAAHDFDPDGLLAAVAGVEAPPAPLGKPIAVVRDAQTVAIENSAVRDLAQHFLADAHISGKDWQNIARGVANGDTVFELWPGSMHLRRRSIKHYSITSLKGSSFEVARVEEKKVLTHAPSQTKMNTEQMLQALRLALRQL